MTANQKQQIQIPGEIRAYLEELLEEGNIMVRDEIKEKMLGELFIELDNYLRTKVFQYLPQDKQKEFIEFAKTNPAPEAVTDYLQKNLPDVQEIFAKAFDEFREMYLESADNAQD